MSEQKKETKKPMGVISIDVETTGATDKDVIVAIGISHGYLTENNEIATSKCPRLVLRLGKPEDISWEDHWKNKGWEKRCYDEFWSNNLNVLDKMQADTTAEKSVLCRTEDSFSNILNMALEDVEAKYEKTIVVSDTTCFDMFFVNKCLLSGGHKPIYYTREGQYRTGFELDSYLTGLARQNPSTDWKDMEQFKKMLHDKYIKYPLVHDHYPENDSHAVLSYFLGGWLYSIEKK